MMTSSLQLVRSDDDESRSHVLSQFATAVLILAVVALDASRRSRRAEEVGDFMAKAADQCRLRLAQIDAKFLTLDVP
jgi:hypothetical protein